MKGGRGKGGAGGYEDAHQDFSINRQRRKFKAMGVCGAAPLTLPSALLAGRMVEREAQRDEGSDLQDDEGDVLQGLPYQLQEGFWLLWRYQVFAVQLFSLVQVSLDPRQT